MFSFAFLKQDAFTPLSIIQTACFSLTYCEDVMAIDCKAGGDPFFSPDGVSTPLGAPSAPHAPLFHRVPHPLSHLLTCLCSPQTP